MLSLSLCSALQFEEHVAAQPKSLNFGRATNAALRTGLEAHSMDLAAQIQKEVQRVLFANSTKHIDEDNMDLLKQALDNAGITNGIVDVVKKMMVAQQQTGSGGGDAGGDYDDHGSAGPRLFPGDYDMFYVGYQLHVGLHLPAMPGGDVIFFFPVCIKESGCSNDHHLRNRQMRALSEQSLTNAWESSTASSGGGPSAMYDVKACLQLMAGVEPYLSESKNLFRAHTHEVLPLLMIGGGGWRFSSGSLLEAGFGFEHPLYGGLYGGAEVSMADPGDGIHLFGIQLSHPKLSMGKHWPQLADGTWDDDGADYTGFFFAGRAMCSRP